VTDQEEFQGGNHFTFQISYFRFQIFSNLHILKSSHPQIFTSSNSQIFKSSNLHILKSSNLHILKSSNPQIFKFSFLLIMKVLRFEARMLAARMEAMTIRETLVDILKMSCTSIFTPTKVSSTASPILR